MAKHMVKCLICEKTFDANTEPFVMKGRRYVHKSCAEGKENEKTQEQKDIEALEEYIKKLFNEKFVNARIKKQIKQFREEYGYTYSGILKALVYFYDIKGHDTEQSNGGIGIVPFIYNQAKDYYYKIWLAGQSNADKNLSEYKPIVREIRITPPERKPTRRRKLFSFLDEEEVN